jgi:PAS domain S-box-containing protein
VDSGICILDVEKNIFTHFHHEPELNSLNNNNVRVFYEDDDGMMWIGTDGGGLNFFNRKNRTFTYTEYNPDRENSLISNVVFTIFKDNGGLVWIGSFQGGVNIYNKNRYKFIPYKKVSKGEYGLSYKSVRAIFQDSDNNIWIGTNGGGLNQFNRKDGTFIHYKPDPLNINSLNGDAIMCVYEDHKRNLWIGTWDQGLNFYDRKKNRFIHYKHEPDNEYSLGSTHVMAVYEDRNMNFWIGTIGGGLDLFDRGKGIFSHYTHDPANDSSISDNGILTMLEDSKGDFWIGTLYGLNLFNREKGSFIRYVTDITNNQSISDNNVRTIFEDSRGNLWFGTMKGGLNRLVDKDKKTFISYLKKDGLPSNTIQDILEDDHGNLWISTTQGLSKFNPQTMSFRNYDATDGLQSNDFDYTAAYRCRNGEMYFGGINGFNVFHPDSIKDNFHIPPIVITDFHIFNKSVKIGEKDFPLQKHVSETDEIELSYKHSVFGFEFAALDYSAPAKNQYAYQLAGYDKDWIYCGNRTRVTYTNIDPGKYVFKVKGSNNDNIWNEAGVSIKIDILPPIWATLWFRIIAVLFVLFLIAAFYRIRLHNITKRNRRLEEVNIKLSEQITERNRAEKEIIKQKTYFEALFNSAPEAIVSLNMNHEIIEINPYFESLFGYTIDEVIGKNIDEIIVPSYGVKESEEMTEQLISGKIIRVESERQKKNGTLIYVSVSGSPIIVEGIQVGVYVMYTDISQRKEAEVKINKSLREKEIMLQEIHHRVKNNLQVICSLLNLQSKYIDDQKALDMFLESRDRVRSMALVHERLYRSNDLSMIDLSKYVRGLVGGLCRSYKSNRVKIGFHIKVNGCALGIDQAVPCGLIINELVSNSLKHAFPLSWEGNQRIGVSLLASKKSEIILTISDNGIGMPQDLDVEHSKTLGLHLVTILVENQLNGKMKIENRNGTKFRIKFKVQSES